MTGKLSEKGKMGKKLRSIRKGFHDKENSNKAQRSVKIRKKVEICTLDQTLSPSDVDCVFSILLWSTVLRVFCLQDIYFFQLYIVVDSILLFQTWHF